MKKTYYVLSVDGRLYDKRTCPPTIFYTSDPSAALGVDNAKFANADAIFIPIVVELPEESELAKRHLQEKNAIIGALRDNARPAQKSVTGIGSIEDRISLFLASRPGQHWTSAGIATQLIYDQNMVIMALCNLAHTTTSIRGGIAHAGEMEYWFEDAKPLTLPERIEVYMKGLYETLGDKSWIDARNVATAMGGVKESVAISALESLHSAGKVSCKTSIYGWLYRANPELPPLELTPTVDTTTPVYWSVFNALKGNKYLMLSEITKAVPCSTNTIRDALLALKKDGRAKESNGLWKKPLAKKPCRIKAKSWREAVIQTLDTQKRPVTAAELENLVEKRYPDKCAGKSIHGAVGSAVHCLKHVQKHQRFKWEKKNGKVVMWTEKNNG